MECNKEEAIRAKGIAEKKMESKDFVGARKVAIKAHQLYPDLENICQIICVCDVHCSTENENLGNEKDWYGILQVEQSADDILIKKQYRKLALLLHPDKNKFAGAEAAFKLIGEAQRVLLDREKRSFFDIKYRRFCQNKAPTNPSEANRNAKTVRQPWGQSNVINNASLHAKWQPQQKAGIETFWTMCPFCMLRLSYYKNVLNKALKCQSCKKPFIAYDMSAQRIPVGVNAKQTATYTRVTVSNQGVSPSAFNGSRSQGNLGQQIPGVGSFAESGQSTEDSRSKETKKFNTAANKVNRRNSGGPNQSKQNIDKKGKKQVVESRRSSHSESSTGSEDVEVEKEGGGDRRRSSRAKRHISYNESGSEDEEMLNSSKRCKSSALYSSPTRETSDAPSKEEATNLTKSPDFTEEFGKSGTEKIDRNDCMAKDNLQRSYKVDNDCVSGSSSNATPKTLVYEVPDPDFSDFDQIRKIDCFKVGQIWAIYDTIDAMPRFYAVIRKVFSSHFKLRITWFEPDPDEEDVLRWVDKELPFSCGKFVHGTSEITEDPLMFSHPVFWEKGQGKDSIKIYPKKEETWALFSNWHKDWMSNPDNHRKYEYEFVEILSEYDESVGICVAFLGKLKGFACIFCRKGGEEVLIPPNEFLRFSHRIPSYRMTGNEREDVPKGSFELDPASISLNLEEMALPKEFSLGTGAGHSAISNTGSLGGNPGIAAKIEESTSQNDQTKIHDKHQSASNDVRECSTTQVSTPEPYEIPQPEFFDFEATKSLDMFQVGQIWALYSDEDGLPKKYGLIKKVDPHSEFKLHVALLQACSLPNDSSLWINRQMPICCGKFKITRSCRYLTYIDSSPFSHQLQAETSKSNVFAIYPRKGEIWALYKNWDVGMTPSDLENCDYDTAEICEESDSHTKVLLLEHVPGYNSVFKAQMSGSSLVTREIPHAELLRFSHQIPSNNLTVEKDGCLKGFKELDTYALPASFWLKVR